MPTSRWWRGCAALVAAAGALTACSPNAPDLASVELVDIGAGIVGPNGLTATVYDTDLPYAASFAFDDAGRLWVGTAAFEPSGADVIAVVDESGVHTVAVTGLDTVLGLLWHDGELFVARAGGVDAYSDFDGETFGIVRSVVEFADGVGEVNGVALAPDGSIVLGISAPCDSCDPADDLSAAIVTFRPDGSDLSVYASDIRAPIGLAFFPGTDVLLVTMNQRDDLGEATPGDWLAAVEEGQSWGFPECYGQGGDECTDQPTPVAELDTHAAVSGLAVVTGELGEPTATAAVVVEWATGDVLAVPLDPADPSAVSVATPFLSGFEHPVAVAVGPDGALYVSDWTTGTVYRIDDAP